MFKIKTVPFVLIFLIASLSSYISQAETSRDSGNGGDAIVCYKEKVGGEVDFVKLLDFWEAENLYNLTIDLKGDGDQELSIRDKLLLIANNLNRINPNRTERSALDGIYKQVMLLAEEADKIEEGGSEFIHLINLSLGGRQVTLRDINDANLKFDLIPFGGVTQDKCTLAQIARQEHEEQVAGAPIKIDSFFWQYLSTDHKVGLLVHEAMIHFFNEHKKNKVEDTTLLRQLVGLLSSKNIKKMNENTFYEKLVQAKLLKRLYHGRTNTGKEVYLHFWIDDELHLTHGGRVYWGVGTLAKSSDLIFREGGSDYPEVLAEFPANTIITFKGQLHEWLRFGKDVTLPVNTNQKTELVTFTKDKNKPNTMGYIEIAGDDSDSLQVTFGRLAQQREFAIQNKTILFAKESEIRFYVSNTTSVKCGQIVGQYSFKDNKGKLIIKKDEYVCFDKNGFYSDKVEIY